MYRCWVCAILYVYICAILYVYICAILYVYICAILYVYICAILYVYICAILHVYICAILYVYICAILYMHIEINTVQAHTPHTTSLHHLHVATPIIHRPPLPPNHVSSLTSHTTIVEHVCAHVHIRLGSDPLEIIKGD